LLLGNKKLKQIGLLKFALGLPFPFVHSAATGEYPAATLGMTTDGKITFRLFLGLKLHRSWDGM
jgi:hypothetical protein